VPGRLREASLVAALLAAFFVLAHRHALPPGRVLCASLAWQQANPSYPLWDQALQFGPWQAFAGRELAQGRLPLWNPHAGCGVAHAANDQAAAFHPLVLLAALVGPAGFFLLALAKHALAGLGLHLFLRARGISAHAALVGAVAFAFSVPLVAWQGYPVSLVLAALGWGLLALERAASGGGVLAIALAVAFAILGGHAQTALHVGLAWSAFALARAVSLGGSAGARFVVRALAGAVLGALLAAPHLLLVLDELARSETLARRAARGAQTFIPWRELVLLVFPDFDGNPRDRNFGPPFDIAWIELGEGSVGAAALVLAVAGALGPKRDPAARLARRALLLGALGLAVVHGAPGFSLLTGIPPLSLVRNHRLVVVVAGALAVAAGAGADIIIRGEGDAPRATLVFALLVAGLRATAGNGSLALTRPPGFLGPGCVGPLGAAGLILGLTFAAGLRRLPRRGLLWGVVAFEQVFLLASGWNPVVPREEFLMPDETTAVLEARVEGAKRGRALIQGDLNVLPPNVLTGSGVDDVGRYDVLGSRIFAPLRDALGKRSDNPDIECFQRVDARLARVLAVSHYVAADPWFDPRWEWDDLATSWDGRTGVVLGENVSTSARFESAFDEVEALSVVVLLDGTRDARLELHLDPSGQRVETNAQGGHAIFRFAPVRGPQWATFRRVDRGPGLVGLAYCTGGRGERFFEKNLAPGKPLALSLARPSAIAADLAPITSRVIEDRGALPRVRWVGKAEQVSTVEEAIALLRKSDHDPRRSVVLTGAPGGDEGHTGKARLVRYESACVEAVSEGDGGWVVLADAWHPGWRATVDGEPAPILVADGALRAVHVPAGKHEVVFEYAPRALVVGWALAGLGFATLVMAASRLSISRFREAFGATGSRKATMLL
jgi:hypothetical protein